MSPTIVAGEHSPMTRVFQTMRRAAPTEATIMITGETGAGKELIAREIHAISGRPGPFKAVNCGAIPRDLLESSLFGHRRGSFTGATADQIGLFASAGQGSVLLDEIGEMLPQMQVKLLRALEEHEVTPVGATEPVAITCRIIAATNANLRRLVARGRFRRDLFFRLNQVPIELPALRDRVDDVPLLVAYFLTRLRERDGIERVMTDAAMAMLSSYSWPGNVRELENIIHRAALLTDSREIGVNDLPDEVKYIAALIEDERSLPQVGWNSTLAEVEKAHILSVMDRCHGRRRRAAAILGINTSTLYRKLTRYGLQEPRKSKSAA